MNIDTQTQYFLKIITVALRSELIVFDDLKLSANTLKDRFAILSAQVWIGGGYRVFRCAVPYIEFYDSQSVEHLAQNIAERFLDVIYDGLEELTCAEV